MKWLWEPLANLLGVGENLTDPKQYIIKERKRLLYRLEASIEYVFVDKREGEYNNISDERAEKLKIHFRKRIFDVS